MLVSLNRKEGFEPLKPKIGSISRRQWLIFGQGVQNRLKKCRKIAKTAQKESKKAIFRQFFHRKSKNFGSQLKNAQKCAGSRYSYAFSATFKHGIKAKSPRTSADYLFYDFEKCRIHKGPPLLFLLK